MTVRLQVGDVVIVDWRGGSLPKEPTKRRPAIVVEESELFPDEYPNIIVVPLTADEGLAHRYFAEPLDPDSDNGATAPCWALAHHVTSVSLRRVTATGSRITATQLDSIRRRIVLAIGR